MFDQLVPIIQNTPASFIQPKQFFIAWSGIPTLAYSGFPESILDLKNKIEQLGYDFKKENPGAQWPKTTLGAINDDHCLSYENLVTLREICDDLNKEIPKEDSFQMQELKIVKFECRSLERIRESELINLGGTGSKPLPIDKNPIPLEHIQKIEDTMNQFSWKNLPAYYQFAKKYANRVSHYRDDFIEHTLIFDLSSLNTQPDYITHFIDRINAKLPGLYSWFKPESRHITIRGMGLDV